MFRIDMFSRHAPESVRLRPDKYLPPKTALHADSGGGRVLEPEKRRLEREYCLTEQFVEHLGQPVRSLDELVIQQTDRFVAEGQAQLVAGCGPVVDDRTLAPALGEPVVGRTGSQCFPLPP